MIFLNYRPIFKATSIPISVSIILFVVLSVKLTSCSYHPDDNTKVSASIVLCPVNIVGCADRIKINDKDYLLSSQNKESSEVLKQIFTKRSEHEFVNLELSELEYTTTKEKGHFPNPMAEFDVIKITKINY